MQGSVYEKLCAIGGMRYRWHELLSFIGLVKLALQFYSGTGCMEPRAFFKSFVRSVSYAPLEHSFNRLSVIESSTLQLVKSKATHIALE